MYICGSCSVVKGGKKLGKWLEPAGGGGGGELPNEAATRETLEETCYKTRLIDPHANWRMPSSDAHLHEVPMPLVILDGGNQCIDNKGHVRFGMLSLGEQAGEMACAQVNVDPPEMHRFTMEGMYALEALTDFKFAMLRAFGELGG